MKELWAKDIEEAISWGLTTRRSNGSEDRPHYKAPPQVGTIRWSWHLRKLRKEQEKLGENEESKI